MIFEPSPHEWAMVPAHMHDGIRNYVQHGIPGGSFLDACLKNDLWQACNRADNINAYQLQNIMRFLDQHAPQGCWGSREKVEQWIKLGGLDGILGKRGPDDNDINQDEFFGVRTTEDE